MNNILQFFSPKSSGEPLLTFLQQCQAHGGHFISFPVVLSEDNNKYEFNNLLKPLRLSRRDKKMLIKDYLVPLSTFTITPDDIHCVISHQGQQAFPCQVCDQCAPGLFKYYGYDVADASWCSQCFERGECLDIPLIEHYRKYGIDDKTIWRHLPRKRWGNAGHPSHRVYQSIEDIEQNYQPIFKLAKSGILPSKR
ncbi:hypothetical protein [Vibrio atypicus]|uniref:hypothetical protein n=1 Tax=Vibrio atypicus TaxID=558271 RepID=UPI0037353AAD